MNNLKGIFSNRPLFFQGGVFVFFLLMGFVLSSICSVAIVGISGESAGNPDNFSFYTLHAVQFFANIFIFVLPATGMAFFCSQQPAQYLGLQKIPDGKAVTLSLLMLLCLFPTIELTSYLNSKLQLPEFMAPIENWMRTTEDAAAQITEKLLSQAGFLPLITNILIIGVMAGLTEELLFRGAILSAIREKIKNPHVAIWIVAFLFSAIHFQFYGFIPRLILGAFLGYLLFWSRSIWIPILVHFLNNTITVAAYKAGLFQDFSESSTFINSDTTPTEFILISIIAAAGLALFYLCAQKMQKN